MSGFQNFGLPDWLVKQCATLGFQNPTEVQKSCIPPTLSGRDVLGCAKTGSGKTAAFLIPILTHLSRDPYGVFAVVISPTRELACQIVDQAKVLGKPINIRVSLVCGGLDRSDQSREVSAKPHIVVATPGRLAELLKYDESVSISKIKYLVFDEADRLFEDSMASCMKTIIENAPEKRQTLLYSATLTSVLQQVLKLAKNEPFQWSNDESETTVQELDQKMIFVAPAAKDTYLVHMVKSELEINPEAQVIVFTSSCKHCQAMSQFLHQVNVSNVALNSAMRQKLRLLSISKFKSKHARVLVTTDVGSRGLDIPDVQLVLNFNVPWDSDTYIHRVGRTARAGAAGKAITFGKFLFKQILVCLRSQFSQTESHVLLIFYSSVFFALRTAVCCAGTTDEKVFFLQINVVCSKWCDERTLQTLKNVLK